MTNKVLKFLLLASPVFYLCGASLKSFDLMFFHIGVAMLFVATLFDTPKRPIIGKFSIVTLLGLCLFNVLMYGLNPVVMNEFISIFLFLLAFAIIVRYCIVDKSIFKYIKWAVLINLVVLGFQFIGYNPILDTTPIYAGSPGGLMGNAPRLVSYLVIVFPLMPLWLIPILLIASFITKEYMLLGIAYIILCFKEWKIAVCLIPIVLIVTYLKYPEILCSINTRIKVWGEVGELFFNRPLIGIGLGINPYTIIMNTDKVIDAFMYNDYFYLIRSVGILAVIWIWWVLKHFIKTFKRSKLGFAVLSLLLLSILEYPFEIHRLWFTIVAIIGLYTIEVYNVRNNIR